MAHIEKSDCFQQCICPFLSAFAGLCQTAFIGNLEDTNMQSTLSQFVFFLFFFFVSFLCLHPVFCFFLRKNADLGFRSLPRKKITKKKQERKRKNKYKAPWRMFLVFHVVFLLWFVFWFVYFVFFVCVFFIIFWFPLN